MISSWELLLVLVAIVILIKVLDWIADGNGAISGGCSCCHRRVARVDLVEGLCPVCLRQVEKLAEQKKTEMESRSQEWLARQNRYAIDDWQVKINMGNMVVWNQMSDDQRVNSVELETDNVSEAGYTIK